MPEENANLHLAPEFDETLLTIELPRQSLRVSLDAICAQLDCRWKLVDSGRGEKPLLRIVPR